MCKSRVGLALAVVLWLVAPGARAGLDQSINSADDFASDVASVWFDTLYDVIKSEGTTPPLAARFYGITAVALYEAVVAGARHHRSLGGQLNALTSVPPPTKHQSYHWPTVANAALAGTIRGLFPSLKPSNLVTMHAVEQRFAARFDTEVGHEVSRRSVARGQAIGKMILAWAATDGSSIFHNCSYVATPVRGAWEPTPPGFNPDPLQPCWGQLRPMVLSSGEECHLPGHPPVSTDGRSQFSAAALEIYRAGVHLTDEQKTIATYWADAAGQTGTPPGHWIAIVGQLSRTHRLSLMASAEAFARVGIALHDAFIKCWYGKYVYNLQRPLTYINAHIDPAWTPYITTPGFPSYPSGHATQSGAAAAVLTDLFGVRAFTDTTHGDHGLVPPQGPRTFPSFEAAAAEAAISRLYGGIHYAFDNDDGLSLGRCIGDKIRERVQFKETISGSGPAFETALTAMQVASRDFKTLVTNSLTRAASMANVQIVPDEVGVAFKKDIVIANAVAVDERKMFAYVSISGRSCAQRLPAGFYIIEERAHPTTGASHAMFVNANGETVLEGLPFNRHVMKSPSPEGKPKLTAEVHIQQTGVGMTKMIILLHKVKCYWSTGCERVTVTLDPDSCAAHSN